MSEAAAPKYIIEHMEEDDDTTRTLPPWVLLEYGQMLKVASPSSTVGFTSLSASTHASISNQLDTVVSSNTSSSSSSSKPPAKFFVSQESILTYLASASPPIPISKVCLLDPKAPKALCPEDGKSGKFEFFLFGGILGDDPPRDRTGELRAMGFEGRHLREVQMTTDTALHVTKLVVEDGIPLEDIKYVDYPTITFNPRESVEMPFRYVADDKGEPILPEGMRKLLESDLNRTFEF